MSYKGSTVQVSILSSILGTPQEYITHFWRMTHSSTDHVRIPLSWGDDVEVFSSPQRWLLFVSLQLLLPGDRPTRWASKLFLDFILFKSHNCSTEFWLNCERFYINTFNQSHLCQGTQHSQTYAMAFSWEVFLERIINETTLTALFNFMKAIEGKHVASFFMRLTREATCEGYFCKFLNVSTLWTPWKNVQRSEKSQTNVGFVSARDEQKFA